MDALPEQEELRRRLRAARALRDLTVDRLAERIPSELRLGTRTLRKLESGERELTEAVLRELARYIDVPFEWFTVPDVGRAIGVGDQSFAERLAALETSQTALWAEIQASRRGSVRRDPPKSAPAPTP